MGRGPEHFPKQDIQMTGTTQIDLEGVMVSEISHRKTNTICSHLYVESKKQMNKQNKTETDS